MSGISELKVGTAVYDTVHQQEGEVVSFTPRAEDGHHESFVTVRLKDGREVHLVEGEVERV